MGEHFMKAEDPDRNYQNLLQHYDCEGMWHARCDNIREVAALGVDMMALFLAQEPALCATNSSQAGIIPDYSEERYRQCHWATDEDSRAMPQRVECLSMRCRRLLCLMSTIMTWTMCSCTDKKACDDREPQAHLIPDIAPESRLSRRSASETERM
jgi:hypothetical protein